MRSLPPEILDALDSRRLVARDFFWIIVKDRETGSPVTDGLWSGAGNVAAAVIHPDTGQEVARDWFGAGTLVQISDIPLVSNLTVQSVEIVLSQINDRINDLVRAYEVKQARVEIYRGLFDPQTRRMVAPAECRFVGFVDEITITTPDENGEGGVSLRCVSHTQEMTRANTDTRSAATQVHRLEGDTFFEDAATVSEWEVFWGSQKGKVPTVKRKKFLWIF